MLGLIGGYLFIFCARICDVSLQTMRTIMLVRGHRIYAAGIGFFEVMIYLVTLKMVFANLTDPLSIIFYAGGFATGNYIGSIIEEKVAVGILTTQVITKKEPLVLAEDLRQKGYGVTVLTGEGREGVRYILQIILMRKCLQELRREIDQWDKEAFLTVFDARLTKGGFLSRKGK